MQSQIIARAAASLSDDPHPVRAHRHEDRGRLDDGRQESGAGGLAAMISLVTPAGRLDRRAVLTEAHRQFRLMRRYGWSFGRCLSFAWAKARERRALVHASSLTVYHPRQRATLLRPRIVSPNI